MTTDDSKPCPFCFGEGQHGTFMGKPCPKGRPYSMPSVSSAVAATIQEQLDRAKEIAELERIWRRPSLR